MFVYCQEEEFVKILKVFTVCVMMVLLGDNESLEVNSFT